MLRLAVVVVALAGCYAPSVGDCQYTCTEAAGCPSGLTCIDNACRVAEAVGRCGSVDDASVDTVEPPPTVAFGNVTNVSFVSGGGLGGTDPTLTADELTMWFARDDKIMVSRRSEVGAEFSNPTMEVVLNASGRAFAIRPQVNATGTRIMLAAGDENTPAQIYTSEGPGMTWQPTARILSSQLNTSPGGVVYASDVPVQMLFSRESAASDPGDLVVADYVGDTWVAGATVEALSSGREDSQPVMTADGREVFFWSHRRFRADLYYAKRADLGAPWSTPTLVRGIAVNGVEVEAIAPWISPDGNVLYFVAVTGASGQNKTIHRAERLP